MAIDTAVLDAMTPPAAPSAPAAPARPSSGPDFHSAFNISGSDLSAAMEKIGAPAAPPAAPAATETPPPETGQPQRDAHGRFVKQNPTEAAPLDAASVASEPTETTDAPPAEGEPTEAPAEEAPAKEAPATIELTLPPTRDGEADVTIETDDPDVAERVRMLKNNGMRRKEYEKRLAAVDRDRQEAVEIITTAQHAPEQLIDRLPAEQQARVAQYYLAKHFDALRPTIAQWWEDPNAVRAATLDFRESNGQAAQAIRTRIEGEQRAQRILRHVESLIPDSASPEDAQDFLRDAENDLAIVARERNGQLTVEDVPSLLAKRIARYGWQAAGSAPASQPAGSATPPVLRPVGQTAESVAQAAARQQQRIQAAQTQRAIAKNVAPPSQGAVPAQRPTPPAATGNTANDWDTLTKFVKSNWNSYAR